MCHVYVSGDGLSGVAISDKDYPQRVAFNMLNKVWFLNHIFCPSGFVLSICTHMWFSTKG